MPPVTLVPKTREELLRDVEQMNPETKAQVSPEWLDRVGSAAADDQWAFGFTIVDEATGDAVGSCGFKAAPDDAATVEIAYGVNPDREGRGFATAAAAAMVEIARVSGLVRIVRAHTLPAPNASARVLRKNGFQLIGTVVDPEDGPVWRWERPATSS